MTAPFILAPGTLYVVATPIGNLGDFSPRAREVLASVDVIAAEDTRHTGQLLQQFGVRAPMVSLHEHNEARRSGELVERLAGGGTVALVCDAGTPLISDPGFDLVAAARAREIPVVAVPGPSALIAALSVAGLPSDRFVFEGFLPTKAGSRRARLEQLRAQERTQIFYEAPHRLLQTLEEMRVIYGPDRHAVVCRELTKRFETTYRGTLQQLCERAGADADMARGEIVLLVSGAPAHPADEQVHLSTEQLLSALLEELSPSQAAKVVARITGEKRSDVYERALRGRPDDDPDT